MSTTHIVAQGEHLPAIATQYGFQSYEPIWNHPKNADLRNKRENPLVLFPGDSIFIPDKVVNDFNRPTGATHKFVVNVAKLKLRVRLLDAFGDPIANEACIIDTGDGAPLDLQTDGDGKVETDVASTVTDATITVGDLVFPVKVGHLDPIDTASGVVGRMSNLGHRYADPDAADQERVGADFAVMLFMDEQNVDPASVAYDPFLEKIRSAHGV